MGSSDLMLKPGIHRKGKVNLLDALSYILKSNLSGEIGALLVFIGVARREGRGGKEVAKLEMESYKKHANKAILKICNEVKRKFKVHFVSIHHLVGQFRVGEPVVLVVVGGARKENVFLAMQESVKRYKKEPALFKKELYVDNSYAWIQ
ncbi:MAG: molybdenum cofactor biosynthesis protein MoaE [Thaumarchaeota archaeon]|nr:molybdenum cofactor biosynthesis protein MoaE [Nitrososphaerota archaeon]